MLRYIIGISIISIVIMIIRRLSNGKILKKHQYALWIMVPVCMILFPFLKIGVTVPEALSSIIPVKETTDTAIISNSESNITPALADQADTVDLSYDREAVDGVVYTDGSVLDGMTVTDYVVTEDVTAVESVDLMAKIEMYIINISIILVLLLTIYNAGFVWYCRKNSKYIGRDPVSGLKIFGIDHKGTPFLLFNRIYVDYSADKMAKYKANNELYIDDATDRINKYVICHEACHFRHGDFIWVIVRHLVLAINWYNPFIWIAFVLSGRDCELACDEEVIRQSGEGSSLGYAESLITLLKQKSEMKYSFTMTTGMRGGYKTMKNRIMSIANPARKSYKTLAVALIATIIVSSCFVLEPRAAETEMPEDDSDTIAEVIVEEPVDEVYISPREQDIFFYRNSIAIKGKLRLPQGEGPFKTVIMCSVSDSSVYDEAAQSFNNNGYATIQFEFSNASEFDAEMLNNSSVDGVLVNEMVSDLSAVMDSLRYLPDVDRSNVYLWGHSLGGFVSAFLGIERQSEIRGIILVDPYLTEKQFLTYQTNPKVIINDYINIYYMFSYTEIPVIFVTASGSENVDELRAASTLTANGSLYLAGGNGELETGYISHSVDGLVRMMKSWD